MASLIRFFAILCMATWAHSAAENDSVSLIKVKPDSIPSSDEIVVTTTRSKSRIADAPASVSVINKKTIASSPAKTIEDLLVSQTGVQASRFAAIGEGIPSSIIIRGVPGALAATRMLVLVDGIPTNASGTPFLIVNEIPMDAIERIEVVRGPFSSLYGANAAGGVINVITQEGRGRTHGTISIETGWPFSVLNDYFSLNKPMDSALRRSGKETYWNADGTAMGGDNRRNYLLSLSYRTIGNYLLSDSAVVRYQDHDVNRDSTYQVPEKNHNYEEFRILGKSRLYGNDVWDVSLHVRYFKSNLGYGLTKYIVPDSMDVETRGQKILVGPQVKAILSKNVTIRGGAFYRVFNGESLDEGRKADQWVYTSRKFNTHDWQVESQGIIKLGSGDVLTVGCEFLNNEGDFEPTYELASGTPLPKSYGVRKAIDNGAVYLQDELKAFDKRLNVVPGVRLDYHSVFGSALSPKLGVLYKISDWMRFRTSAGRSFRAPSLAELYLPDFPIVSGVMLKSNPDLKPEYLWGFDAGIDLFPARSLTVKIGPYYNTMKNLISQTVFTDTTALLEFYISHLNISSAWSKGLEGEVEWRCMPGLTLSANGTVQDSKDEAHGVPLDYVPNFTYTLKLNAGRTFAKCKAEAQLELRRVGKRQYLNIQGTQSALLTINGLELEIPLASLEPYTTVDASCRVSFPCRISLTLGAINIFNTKYQEAYGALAPGRFATIKAGYDF